MQSRLRQAKNRPSRDRLTSPYVELCGSHFAIFEAYAGFLMIIISEVNAFTPSALSTILLCAAKDESNDYATIYAALRRHLSTSHTERHYDEGHAYQLESTDNRKTYRNVCELSSFHLSTCEMPISLKLILMKITAFTVPYFSLTERPPALDQAPLSPSGIFGVDAQGEKYIREQKFSVSWSGGLELGAPSLMVALNPLSGYHDDLAYRGEQPSAPLWIRNNLLHIVWKWEEVLDSLDEQTTLPVWSSHSVAFGFYWLQSLFANRRSELHYFR